MNTQIIPRQTISAKIRLDIKQGDVESLWRDEYSSDSGGIRLSVPQANALIEALSKAIVEAQQ